MRLVSGLTDSPSFLVTGLVHSVPPSAWPDCLFLPAAAASAASSTLVSLLIGRGLFTAAVSATSSVLESSQVGSGLPSATAAAALSCATSIVATLPRLVSSEGPPTQQELQQLQLLLLWSGEMTYVHIA